MNRFTEDIQTVTGHVKYARTHFTKGKNRMTNTQETNYLRDIHKISLALQGIDKKLGIILQKIEISEDKESAEDSRENSDV